METKEQIERYKTSAAESFASLSIGLWTVSIIGYLSSGISLTTYLLSIGGAISVLFCVYLLLPWNWKKKTVLESLKINKIIRMIKLLVWYIVLWVFWAALMQTKVIWLMVTGTITISIIIIVFYIVLARTKKDTAGTKRSQE